MTINYKILYYDRIDSSKGIDINKTNASIGCNICYYFLDKGFKFQPDIWNGYHNLLLMSMNLSNIAILNITTGVDYRCIVKRRTKSEAIN